MRLGLIAPEFPPAVGGVQVYSYEVAAELARRGHELTVFTPFAEADAAAFPFKVVPALRQRIYADEPLLRAASVDLWHGMNAGCAWLVRLGRPVTLTVHGNDFLAAYSPFARLDVKARLHLPVGSRLDRWLGQVFGRRRLRQDLPRAAHIFTNSAYTQSRLQCEFPGRALPTSVAGVGVASRFFASPLAAPHDGPMRVVTAARLDDPRKNIRALIHAAASLRDRHAFELVVLGDGATRPALVDLAARLGVAHRVHFAGRVNDATLVQQLQRSDLFVLTSEETRESFEGFGLVYLEANACGTPVLAARTGGVTEAVVDGATGFFADGTRPEQIAAALDRFLRKEITFVRARCRDHAATFTWRRVVDRMETVFASLAGPVASLPVA